MYILFYYYTQSPSRHVQYEAYFGSTLTVKLFFRFSFNPSLSVGEGVSPSFLPSLDAILLELSTSSKLFRQFFSSSSSLLRGEAFDEELCSGDGSLS